jgi:hypothetical protein
MREREAYGAANEAYQKAWRAAASVRGDYTAALRALEHKSPDDPEGAAPFLERFVAARSVLRDAEARATALLQEREAAYKVLVAAGG